MSAATAPATPTAAAPVARVPGLGILVSMLAWKASARFLHNMRAALCTENGRLPICPSNSASARALASSMLTVLFRAACSMASSTPSKLAVNSSKSPDQPSETEIPVLARRP